MKENKKEHDLGTNGLLVGLLPKGSSYSCIQMNGKETFHFAMLVVPRSIELALEKASLTRSSIDWLLLHQFEIGQSVAAGSDSSDTAKVHPQSRSCKEKQAEEEGDCREEQGTSNGCVPGAHNNYNTHLLCDDRRDTQQLNFFFKFPTCIYDDCYFFEKKLVCFNYIGWVHFLSQL